MKQIPAILLSASVLVVAAGCVQTAGRTVYTQAQANQAMRVELGTVVGVRSAVIEGEANAIGMWGGGAIGAAAASGVGTGTAGAVATAAGGVAGAIVGEQVQKGVNKEEAYEITVVLDNGQTLVIVQETSKGGFYDGDRVRVLIGQGTSIVLH